MNFYRYEIIWILNCQKIFEFLMIKKYLNFIKLLKFFRLSKKMPFTYYVLKVLCKDFFPHYSPNYTYSHTHPPKIYFPTIFSIFLSSVRFTIWKSILDYFSLLSFNSYSLNQTICARMVLIYILLCSIFVVENWIENFLRDWKITKLFAIV